MSSINSFTVADYLLTRLHQLGLRKVFQVPGDYVANFMDALEQFDGVEAVGDLTELGAGYAADGYARLTGIGAVSVQFGVGTFSVLNAIAGSYVERNPVVVITASPSTGNRKTIKETGVLFHHSTGDLLADSKVFANVTVAAEVLSDPSDAWQQIDKALTLAITFRRPIYLEAWQDVWGLACEKPEGELKALPLISEEGALKAILADTLKLLNSARQPLVLLGVEINRFGLQDAVLDLLKTSGLPYSTTSLAKTVISENEGFFIGTYADGASFPATVDYVEKADAVLALGVIFTDDYLTMLSTQFDQMIVVNNDETSRLGQAYYHQVFLADFILQLTDEIKKSSLYPRQNSVLPLLPPQPQITPALLQQDLSYQNFFDLFYGYLLQHQLQDKITLILGESSSLYMSARLYGLPQDSFIADAAWGSLGHETGCVTGIAYASDKRAMAIAGDGGFMMMCQCLSTISRHQLNSVVFVISNKVYAIEQSFVDICAFAKGGHFAPFDLLPTWDYHSLAKAFAVEGYRVQSGEELLQALEQIMTLKDKPALVEVVIPSQDLAPAMAGLVKSITGHTVEQCAIPT
ncbi:thiamine pyrophosphate-binding protein [Rheinheimera soli]|uniref:Indolepyruvate decarboxylase n=1 Tax=Rheinheimera soli TaxID=443616 RepID=A0ABU1W050_9GAMM|nr:thiamine pyrophosphate-binding protein [Rheinheimera soli]MDR7121336.1 indolepyruvate decarboxylase [Rheinheimera soli]